MSGEESDERMVRYTAAEIDAMLARGESETDWERVKNLTDEEIESSIDFEEEGEFDWDVVYLVRDLERIEAIVTFRCDFDLFEWFQEHSDTIKAQIGRLLTDHVTGHRDHADH
jgi:hypothetical protein